MNTFASKPNNTRDISKAYAAGEKDAREGRESAAALIRLLESDRTANAYEAGYKAELANS